MEDIKVLYTKEPRESSMLIEAFIMVENKKIYRVIGWFSNKFQKILQGIGEIIIENFEVDSFIPNGVISTFTTRQNINFTIGLIPCTDFEYGDYLGNDSGVIVITSDIPKELNKLDNLIWMN